MQQKYKRGHIAYAEDELLLGMKMMEKLEKITDIMLYFLDRESLKFTYIFIQVNDEKFEEFLHNTKRNTDVLIPVSKEDMIYAIVCQETDIEGGYRFAERIIRLVEVEEGKEVLLCNGMTVSATHFSTQQIILRLLEKYLKHKNEYSENPKMKHLIDFSTLS